MDTSIALRRVDAPSEVGGSAEESMSFAVLVGGHRTGTATCGISYEALATLGQLPQDDDERTALLARLLVPAIEARLASNEGITELKEKGSVKLLLTSNNVAVGGLAVREKVCDYQLRSHRDLWCLATAPTDDTVRRVIQGRNAAPTSRPFCEKCEIPDVRSRCSHFLHPEVISLRGSSGAIGRKLIHAMCDQAFQGRVEQSPNGCQPSGQGHDCWERLIATERPRIPQGLDPIALAEGLDQLSDVWRVAFDERLTSLPSSADAALLSQEASSREEMADRLRALAEVLQNFRVSDSLLPPDLAKQYQEGSLNRLENALRQRLGDERTERAVPAIEKLRAILRLDNSFSHPTGEQPALCAQLGIPYPPTDWEATWNSVRWITIVALRELRSIVRALDSESAGQ